MCLFVNWYTLKHKAKKDIVVYKVLDHDAQIKDLYRTMCRDFAVAIGDTQVASSLKKIWDAGYALLEERATCFVVEEGIHSFASREGAASVRPSWSYSVIVKCIIPKGEYYYKGFWLAGEKIASYASKSLKIIEISYE